ncbi:uncharacterized protein Asalp_26200 [Aeromonas salmonicida subsp. pectinolytica 34mel]|uniref:Uncharacterized protein n=1 Tax=Aeromonas salmonicida subsp. pectinolytica 34mel TaxID=1324960 RepID=A0A2D1QHS6_AERSA|nr:uncharacterized protein Asalp_26200 [Aeromonas salmonicida subsp. pectinolytica 34mel]
MRLTGSIQLKIRVICLLTIDRIASRRSDIAFLYPDIDCLLTS